MFGFNEVESEKSFNPIVPGEKVAVTLTKVELTDDGDLDFFFKGSDPENAGDFKPRFWLGNLVQEGNKKFAENPDKWKKDSDNEKKQLRQILEAFLNDKQVNAIKGNTIREVFVNVRAALNPTVTEGIALNMKIVYKWDSDVLTVLPTYRAFISSATRPRMLKLNPKLNNKGLPFDRILPLADYGVAPQGGAPSAPAGFGNPTAPVPGGPDANFGTEVADPFAKKEGDSEDTPF